MDKPCRPPFLPPSSELWLGWPLLLFPQGYLLTQPPLSAAPQQLGSTLGPRGMNPKAEPEAGRVGRLPPCAWLLTLQGHLPFAQHHPSPLDRISWSVWEGKKQACPWPCPRWGWQWGNVTGQQPRPLAINSACLVEVRALSSRVSASRVAAPGTQWLCPALG